MQSFKIPWNFPNKIKKLLFPCSSLTIPWHFPVFFIRINLDFMYELLPNRAKEFFFLLPTFQSPWFSTMFPYSDLFEKWYSHSLNHYLDTCFHFFLIPDLLVKFQPFWIQNIQENSIDILPSAMYKYFCFWLQYSTFPRLHGTWENSVSIRPSP